MFCLLLNIHIFFFIRDLACSFTSSLRMKTGFYYSLFSSSSLFSIILNKKSFTDKIITKNGQRIITIKVFLSHAISMEKKDKSISMYIKKILNSTQFIIKFFISCFSIFLLEITEIINVKSSPINKFIFHSMTLFIILL